MNKIKSTVAALAATLGLGMSIASGNQPNQPPPVVVNTQKGDIPIILPSLPMITYTITRKGQYHQFRNVKKSARAAAKRAAVRNYKKYRA